MLTHRALLLALATSAVTPSFSFFSKPPFPSTSRFQSNLRKATIRTSSAEDVFDPRISPHLQGQKAATVGLIIVDHGSKREAANTKLLELASAVKARTGRAIVEAAHMELASPTVAEAYAACVAQGATKVVCHPYFLSPGRHVTEDIPEILEEASKAYPDVPYTLTAPLGSSDLVPDLISEVVEETLRNEPADASMDGMDGFFGDIMRMTQALESERTADAEASEADSGSEPPSLDKPPLSSEEIAAKPPPSPDN